MKISYAPAIHFYLSPTELLTTTIFIVLPFPECHIAGIRHYIGFWEGFPGSSAGKESACSAGDSGSLPGSGRFPGEGIGYPLQYSWVSLVAQTVENPLTIQETRVWFLGWGHPLEKGMATLSSVPTCRIPRTEEPAACSPRGRKGLDTAEPCSTAQGSF